MTISKLSSFCEIIRSPEAKKIGLISLLTLSFFALFILSILLHNSLSEGKLPSLTWLKRPIEVFYQGLFGLVGAIITIMGLWEAMKKQMEEQGVLKL